MNKTKFIISLGIFCLFFTITSKFALADDFSEAMKEAFQQFKKESLSFYTSLGNCTAYSTPDELYIIEGQSNGYCNIKQYMLVNNQRYQHLDCKVPINEVKVYAEEKINELENGDFSYNSSTDRLNQFCTPIHHTIENQNGSINTTISF